MPSNQEEPSFLQDFIIPQERKETPQGFDIDRDFGKGAREYVEGKLRGYLRPPFPRVNDDEVLEGLSSWRILFGENPRERLERLRQMDELSKLVLASLESGKYEDAARYLSCCVALFGKSVFIESFWKSEKIANLEQFLRTKINDTLSRKKDVYYAAARYAPQYRIVFGGTPWDNAQQEIMSALLKDFFPRDRESGFPHGAFLPAHYRILQAHEVRSTDHGIEIIDTPPLPFKKQELPPMPEERAF